VQSISGTVNGVQNPGFRHDANGNLTCEYTGPNCSHGAITKETDAYWSFNMAHTVTDGSTSLTLTYDSEHARVTQAMTTASTTSTTTYLNDPINGAMSEKVATGTSNTWNDYLTVDGKLIGERTCTGPAPPCTGGATLQYFVLDHLGSVAVVTDATGAVTSRESFDAWGKQRNEDGSDDTTCSNGLTAPTTKGFTGQEEIGALCLVNLNARLYDPSIGRFLAADSVVPDPEDGQSYNRYTYVDNRPLSLIDPTGHDPDGPQLGECGIVCISFVSGQVSPSSYPNARCFGACPLGSGLTGFDGDPGKTLLIPKGNVELASNSDGEIAQAFGQAADNSFTKAASQITYSCGSNGWCTGSDGSIFPPNADGNFPDQPAPPAKMNAEGANGGCKEYCGGVGPSNVAGGIPQVTLNRLQGQKAEEQAEEELIGLGFSVTRYVVFKDPATGRTAVIDMVAHLEGKGPSGGGSAYLFVEVKSGNGQLTVNQAAVATALQNGSAIPIGPNARAVGLIPGQPTGPQVGPVFLVTQGYQGIGQ
jgi:RHS repeat-associated protein